MISWCVCVWAPNSLQLRNKVTTLHFGWRGHSTSSPMWTLALWWHHSCGLWDLGESTLSFVRVIFPGDLCAAILLCFVSLSIGDGRCFTMWRFEKVNIVFPFLFGAGSGLVLFAFLCPLFICWPGWTDNGQYGLLRVYYMTCVSVWFLVCV